MWGEPHLNDGLVFITPPSHTRRRERTRVRPVACAGLLAAWIPRSSPLLSAEPGSHHQLSQASNGEALLSELKSGES